MILLSMDFIANYTVGLILQMELNFEKYTLSQQL